jgi:hypothetical protein
VCRKLGLQHIIMFNLSISTILLLCTTITPITTLTTTATITTILYTIPYNLYVQLSQSIFYVFLPLSTTTTLVYYSYFLFFCNFIPIIPLPFSSLPNNLLELLEIYTYLYHPPLIQQPPLSLTKIK